MLIFMSLLISACSDPREAPAPAAFASQLHPVGWLDKNSDNFHGKAIANDYTEIYGCQQCHGIDYTGGLAAVSCFECHSKTGAKIHPQGWLENTSADFHGQVLANNYYNIQGCQYCHGDDYSGGLSQSSCLECHTQTAGPAACNTCHGNLNADPTNLANVAPPRGLDGETDSTDAVVGAHKFHIEWAESVEIACQGCHVVPETATAAGHLDNQPGAEVIFNGMAAQVTGSGTNVPEGTFDRSTNSCSNVYCHGDWIILKENSPYKWIYTADKMEGNYASPVWNNPESVTCGTCHDLPPKGHRVHDMTVCYYCHGLDVIDENGNLTGSDKHINGKIDLVDENLQEWVRKHGIK